MGEVYLAQDTQLDRTVAVKMLPADVARDQARMRRFVQEAKAASALNHPNIAHIYEIGEADGVSFIAMEHVEGQALDDVISGCPLDTEEIIRIGIQVADALDEAHAKGITHRDIKPSNIMITQRGGVKVLDFGLAKVARPAEQALPSSDVATQVKTAPGMVMGTVQYMSPEQALGREVDHRTDIFSVSVTLYQMATGKLPFSGATFTEVIDRIAHVQPEAIARFNYNVPAELERIIRKGLEKDRDRRYQSARELQVDLKNLKRDSDSSAVTVEKAAPQQRAQISRLTFVASALVVLALVGVGLYFLSRRDNAAAIDSIAVLPLVNASADPNTEYLSDGITESLINSLSQLPKLRVIARTTMFRYKGREVDPQKVGRELGVKAVLTGKVLQRGDSLIIQADLVDVADGSQLWGEQYNRKFSDILAVQGEIAKQISQKLRMRLTGKEQQRVTKSYTENTAAYQLYLKGRYFWSKRTEEGLNKATEHIQQAIDIDPNYALAYVGLADCYNLLGFYSVLEPKEEFPRAKAAATKALEIDDTLAEAHASLGYVKLFYDWDLTSAESELKQAIELNPNYATAHHWYGVYLQLVGRFDQALVEMRRALELDPLSPSINANVGWPLYYARQYDQAIEQFQKAVERDQSSPLPHHWLAMVYGQKGMYEEAITEYQKALELSGSRSRIVAELGYIYAVSGRRSEAQKALKELKELSKRRHVSSFYMALISMGLGEKDQAFASFETAYEERSPRLIDLKVDPIFDPLRSDPRFAVLIRKMGLTP
jgi:serine/threonine-protein kinase